MYSFKHHHPFFRLLISATMCFGITVQAAELGRHLEALKPFAKAEFKQVRHVEALSRPLVSSGSVELSATGFIWKQAEPFNVWLIYDGISIVEKTVVGGRETRRRVLDPATSSFTRTMFQVMTGSFADLQSAFVIKPRDHDQQYQWHYELEPRDATIKKAISRIILSGDEYLREIRIEESLHNYTQIELTNQRSSE